MGNSISSCVQNDVPNAMPSSSNSSPERPRDPCGIFCTCANCYTICTIIRARQNHTGLTNIHQEDHILPGYRPPPLPPETQILPILANWHNPRDLSIPVIQFPSECFFLPQEGVKN